MTDLSGDPAGSSRSGEFAAPGQRPTGGVALAKRLLATLRLLEAVRALAVAAERVDPSRRLGLRRSPPLPPLGLVCVYRARNAQVVAGLLRQLGSGGTAARVALWALDEVPEALAAVTVGVGPGLRLPLLQECVDVLDLPEDAWLVLADDDVALPEGGLADVVRLAAGAGLDLAQPAHSFTSHWNWAYTRRRLLTVCRVGGFVETGPLVLLGPAGRRAALPLPPDGGMGWGLELAWWSLRAGGIRLGIVDAVPMRHLVPVSDRYDLDVERERVDRAFAAHGLRDWGDLQVDDAQWRAWARPPRRAPAPA